MESHIVNLDNLHSLLSQQERRTLSLQETFSDGENAEREDDDPQNKKLRIPWDRNPRGDRNNLKIALMSCINDNDFHVKGTFRENFKRVSYLLSADGAAFHKWKGISISGAQRKFNSILRDVSKTFRLQENGEFEYQDGETAPFESLAQKMLKDIIEKEKVRRAAKRGSSSMMIKTEDGDETGLVEEEYGEDLASFLLVKKRKSDAIDLKQTFRKAAANMLGGGGEVVEAESAADGGMKMVGIPQIHRLDSSRHNFVMNELLKQNPPIHTVYDLLQRADVSPAGIQSFAATTGINLDKPVDRLLKIYEEVASSYDYTAQMKHLCGLMAGDALEFENFIKPLYTVPLQG